MTINDNTTSAMMSDRRFGIELEVECVNMSQGDLALVVASAGVVCASESYNHMTSNNWKVVTDASVDGGFEVVSPILQGEAGILEAKKVAKALARAGVSVNKTCGFHVHVDAAGLSKHDILNVVKRYHKFNDQIDSWMPVSRRADNNIYCKDMACVVNGVLASSVDTSATMARIVGRIGDRRYKVNLEAYVRHGTIEFRQHSGTVNAAKIESWVRFCVAFVAASKTATITQTVEETVTETVYDEVVEHPGVDESPLRANAQVKKFRKMAELFMQHQGRYNFISYAALARELEISESSVPSYVSQFRAKYDLGAIRVRSGKGYYYDGYQNLVERVGGPVVRRIPRTVTRVVQKQVETLVERSDDTVFFGVSSGLQSFYQERAMELSAAI